MFMIEGKELTYEGWSDYTVEKLINPKVGDRYQEMYSFWMYVVHIDEVNDKKYIYTAHFSPPCEVNAKDAVIYKHDKNGLLRHYTYESISGSWLHYEDNKPEHVEGIFEEYIKMGKVIDSEKYVIEMPKKLETIE